MNVKGVKEYSRKKVSIILKISGYELITLLLCKAIYNLCPLFFIEQGRGLYIAFENATVGQQWKNSAIRTCWINERGAIKLYLFSRSTEQREGCNFIASQAFIQQLYYYYFFYCLTIEQFLIQVLSEVRHTCWRGVSKMLYS